MKPGAVVGSKPLSITFQEMKANLKHFIGLFNSKEDKLVPRDR